MTIHKIRLTLVIVSALLAAGCSSTGGSPEDAAGANSAGFGANTNGVGLGYDQQGGAGAFGSNGSGFGGAGGGRGGAGRYSAADLDNPSSPLSKKVVYFQYDSSEVSPEYVPVVTAHAEFLAGNSTQQVTLEGHADERGTREYNIALGEQRAKSIANMLRLQGVTDAQMRIVSYGEEKPNCMEHDDACWHQNRRVEFAYPGH